MVVMQFYLLTYAQVVESNASADKLLRFRVGRSKTAKVNYFLTGYFRIFDYFHLTLIGLLNKSLK